VFRSSVLNSRIDRSKVQTAFKPQNFSCRKRQVGLQSRIGVACVQENGKFQSFRCSDTEIELEIAGEQLK
jgi:hypothetical protein